MSGDTQEQAVPAKKVRGSIATKEVQEANCAVVFNFADGSKITAEMSKLKPETVTRAALHGLSQTIGDSYSGCKDVEEAKKCAVDRIKRIYDGEWRATREAGAPRVTMLAGALARVTGKTVEEALEVIGNLDEDARKELRGLPQVKVAMAEIKAENLRKEAEKDNTDLGALFAGKTKTA